MYDAATDLEIRDHAKMREWMRTCKDSIGLMRGDTSREKEFNMKMMLIPAAKRCTKVSRALKTMRDEDEVPDVNERIDETGRTVA